MKTYEVAVAAPVPITLTYGQPVSLGPEDKVSLGMRVLVSLGRRKVTGYVVEQNDEQTVQEGGFDVKPILELLDPEPVFPQNLIPLYRWIADYYHFPIGEVIRTALPGGLTTGSSRMIRLSETGRQNLPPTEIKLNGPGFEWVNTLLDKGELTAAVTGSLWRKPPMQSLLRKWQKNGWIVVEEGLRRKNFQEKKQFFVTIAKGLSDKVGGGLEQQEEFLAIVDELYPAPAT